MIILHILFLYCQVKLKHKKSLFCKFERSFNMYELKIKSKEDKLNLNKEKEAIITSEDLAQPSSQKQTDTEPDHIVYDMFFSRIYG